MNTAVTGLEQWPAQTYFPSLMEVLIMLGIAATGFSAFALIVRFLPIFAPVAPRRGEGDCCGAPAGSMWAASASKPLEEIRPQPFSLTGAPCSTGPIGRTPKP